MKKIGLALGGGGARGFAHVQMLEAFDELGIRPHRIAGTSVGAVLGALYASGLSGLEVRDHVAHTLGAEVGRTRGSAKKKPALKWIKLLDPMFGGKALFKGTRILSYLYEAMGVSTFAQLEIPLRVVATDFWASKAVVLEHGPLLPAVKASMAIPGVFAPETIGGRVLVDGGGVNPLPYNLLDDCDIVVAIDVTGDTAAGKGRIPNFIESVFSISDIMQRTMIAQQIAHHPPDIYIKPDLAGISLLDFHKASDVYDLATNARRKLTRLLKDAIS